jgi:hypothetical protein
MTYEYGGSHFKSTNPPSNFQECAKNAIAQHFSCPAPLIGPAEAATIPPVFSAPFVWILTGLPQQHMQMMINQVVWSFPTVTLFALAYQPEISHFLFTLDGLLFSPDQGVDVANLVVDTYRNNPQAQAFLMCIHDAYPPGVNPMDHFTSSIRVSATELTVRVVIHSHEECLLILAFGGAEAFKYAIFALVYYFYSYYRTTLKISTILLFVRCLSWSRKSTSLYTFLTLQGSVVENFTRFSNSIRVDTLREIYAISSSPSTNYEA